MLRNMYLVMNRLCPFHIEDGFLVVNGKSYKISDTMSVLDYMGMAGSVAWSMFA